MAQVQEKWQSVPPESVSECSWTIAHCVQRLAIASSSSWISISWDCSANGDYVPNKHSGWSVACVCIFSVPSPLLARHPEPKPQGWLFLCIYLDKRQLKGKGLILALSSRWQKLETVPSTVKSREKMHACIPTARLMFSNLGQRE